MNTNLISALRIAVSALALVMLFSSATANAYTSNGTDGKFQPTVSVVLDSTQQIFNFTSIFIPSGVTVSFSGLASAWPIELLATENIDIAGTLDAGANSLWIETPGSISFSGFLNNLGSTLVLVSGGGSIILSGTINGLGGGSVTGGGIPVINGGGGAVITGIGGILTSGGSNLSICSTCSTTLTLSPVPEPGVWVMLSLGLCALFAASRLRNQNIRLA